MKIIGFIVLLVILCSLSVSANAALVDNNDGTITQIRNDGSMLMWLQDANYAYTSGYSTTYQGRMTWDQSQTWISTLNSSNYLGYNDWQLPDTLPVNGIEYNYNYECDGSSDIGYNITSPNSMMAYMYYVELGNIGYRDTNCNYRESGWGLHNTGPFDNLQADDYWSGTTSPSNPIYAWNFSFSPGGQPINTKDYGFYAWVVRPAGVVPEPISSILFVIGGALLAGTRFIRRKA